MNELFAEVMLSWVNRCRMCLRSQNKVANIPDDFVWNITSFTREQENKTSLLPQVVGVHLSSEHLDLDIRFSVVQPFSMLSRHTKGQVSIPRDQVELPYFSEIEHSTLFVFDQHIPCLLSVS